MSVGCGTGTLEVPGEGGGGPEGNVGAGAPNDSSKLAGGGGRVGAFWMGAGGRGGMGVGTGRIGTENWDDGGAGGSGPDVGRDGSRFIVLEGGAGIK